MTTLQAVTNNSSYMKASALSVKTVKRNSDNRLTKRFAKSFFLFALIFATQKSWGQCIITAQPQSTQTICQGTTPTNLVVATSNGTTFQWYSDNDNTGNDGSSVSGATSSSYTPPTGTAGTFFYYCVITGACGTVPSNYATVTVNGGPVVGEITGTFTVCVGATTQLSSTTGGGVLSSSNPSVATVSSNGQVTGVSAGTTVIDYMVTGVNGCITTVSATITVNAVPVVAAIGGNFAVCMGSSNQLSNATGGGVWNSGNPAAATISSTGLVTSVSQGLTTISYAVTASGCTNTVYENVYVFNLPVVEPVTGTSIICVGGTTQLSSETHDGVLSSRSPGVATVSDLGLVTGISAGTAIIDYTVTVNGCSTTASITITVNALPAAVAGTDRSICSGSSTTIGAVAVSGRTYNWTSSPSGFSSSSANPTVSPTATTVYTVTETITATGCANSHSVTVTVNALPAAVAGSDRGLCTGSSTTLGAAAVAGSTYSWSSVPGGFSSTSANPTVSPTVTTVYTVTETVTATGCTNSHSVTVTVNPLPATPTISGTAVFCDGSSTVLTSSAATGYQWNLGGSAIAGQTGSTLTVTAAGSYTVTITNANGCNATSAATAVTVNPSPTVAAIGGGAATVCMNSSTPAFTDATANGTWSITPVTGTASITAGGVVTGLTAGTVTVNYSVTASGCTRTVTTTVTVNGGPVVAPITGPFTVCAGQQIQLGDATPGGTTSSRNPGIATVNTTGLVTGVSAGSAIIDYTVIDVLTGCSTTVSATITVNAVPNVAAIAGNFIACMGSTTQLSNATGGGVWNSGNPAAATISSTGLVTSVSQGLTTISYAVTASGCTNTVYENVYVFNLPVVEPVTGTSIICVGGTTQLSSETHDGVLSSRSPGVATVSDLGLVTGISAGTAIIDYTVTVNGCSTTASITITVNALPAAVAGTDRSICSGSSTTIGAVAVSGRTYNWTSSPSGFSSSSANPTVSPTATTVYTVTETITATGCANSHSVTVTVNALPAAVAGSDRGLCTGSSTTLGAAAVAGSTYSWSSVPGGFSSTSANPTVSPTVTTVYTVTETVTATGCTNSHSVTVTVNPLPATPTISGTAVFCDGSSTVLTSSAATGYQWNLGGSAIAGQTGSTLTVTAAGSYTVTITNANGCNATSAATAVTVNPSPTVAAIGGGAATVCMNSSTPAFTDATANGTWSITPVTGTASITAGGVVTGLTAGTVTVNYSVTASGCTRTVTTTVTVNGGPVVAPITGPFTVCAGQQIQLGDATPGGTTSSRNPGIATVNTTGLVTGVSAGSAIIDYTVIDVLTGCSTTVSATITVNAVPNVAAIAGNFIACMGSTTQLSNATGGGVWNSGNPAAATISSTGLVTSVSQGLTTISYAVTASGCTNTVYENVYVFNLPVVEPVTGTSIICVGGTTQLSSETHDGVLSSRSPGVATVSDLGLVTGISAGTAIIDYTVTVNGCSTTASITITVNALPAAVAGTDRSICSGSSTTIGAVAVSGRTYNWTSSPSGFSSSSANPTVSPTATTVYTVTETITATGCANSHSVTVTVNALPAAVAGSDRGLCTGSSTTIGAAAVSGSTYSWSSSPGVFSSTASNPAVSPTVTTVYTVTETVTATGCTNSHSVTVTVNPLPATPTISGTAVFCDGSSTVLTSSAATGYQWNLGGSPVSGQTGSTLTVTAAGSYTVTITNANGCNATSAATVVTVNPSPAVAAIGGGAATVCVNSSTPAFTDATANGTWSITPVTGTASITAGGVVTGLTAGTVTVNYSVTASGCTRTVTTTVTVNGGPVVGEITGTFTVCVGATTQLSSTTGGGVLSSSNPSVATVSSNGQVTGVSAGTTVIDYMVTGVNGCITTVSATITVNAVPVVAAIGGNFAVCMGSSNQLSNATGGGVWNSGNPAAATISSGGLVTPVAPGISTISYAVTAIGCTNTVYENVYVFNLPVVEPVTGTSTICVGGTTQLSSETHDGVLSSRSPGIATVSELGLVTGISAGTAVIDYTVTANGCSTTASITITVNALPAAVAGTDRSICSGSSTTIGAVAVSGRTYNWTSSPSGFSSSSANPTVSPTATTTYTVTETVTATGCSNSHSVTVTVNPLPAADAGTDRGLCTGSSTTIGAAAVSGSTYSWSSSPGVFSSTASNPAVSPTVTTVYTVTETVTATGCTNSHSVTVTVNPLPAAEAGIDRSICTGASTSIGAAAVGGSTYLWTSSPSGFTSSLANPSISPAATTTYTLVETITATGCTNTHSATITVNQSPVADAGTDRAICTGASTTIGATAVNGSTYSWTSSPAGFTSSSANPSVSPIVTTIYTLVETITAGGCTNTHSVTVTVNPLPVAATGADRDICTGASTTIGATTVSGSIYSWTSSPAGFTSSSANPTVSPTETTTYTVTETITATGCTNTHSVIVTVNPLPTATAGADRAICTGASTAIGATTVSGSTYSWISSPAGFTSSSANPSVSPTETTTYILTETITATGCTNTHSVTVTVNPLPAAVAGTDRAICTGASTTIGATTVSGSTYSWISSPLGFTSPSANPSVSPTVTNTYTVTETITATGCTNTHSVTVTVNPLPAAVAGTDRAICTGASTIIGATTVSGSTYSWSSSPSGFTSSSANPSVSPTETTTYTVTETITATGCTNTHTVTVTVNPLPAAVAGTDRTICSATPTTIGATAVGGSTYLWTSSPAGFTSSLANPSVSPIETTTYTLIETITATGCTNTHSVTVTVNPLPATPTISGTTSFCAGASTTLTSSASTAYQWNLGGAPISGQTASTLVATAAGSYSVTITDANGCSTTSAPASVTVNPLPAAVAGTNRDICTGASTTIGATTVGGSTYSWTSSPAGFTSSSANPSVSPTETTTYTLIETVTATGCTNTHSVTVTVNPLPVAATGADRAICTGASTTIGATTVSGSIYSWTSSPAGFTSSSANPSASPTTTTTYTLIETITATGCTNTHSVTVTVNALPAAVAGTDRAICTGTSTTIGATTVSGSTYSWISSPSGFTSSSANPTVNPTITTVYTVTETITATGCTNTHSVTVTVNPLPAAVAGTDRAICTGTSTTIGSTTVSGSTYSWVSSPAGFTSSSANPSVSPTETTTYTVTETITATGCTNTHSVTVTVNPLPAAVAGTDRTICSATPTIIGATAVAGSTYSWISSPAGFTSSSANPTVSPTTTTTYTVVETITATGCSNTNAVTVTVNPLPAAATGADRAICTGTSTTIGATTVSGSTYSWISSPLGFTSPSANPSVSPIETTTYTLIETITATGCTNTHSVTVTVNPLPAAVTGADRTICSATPTIIGATAVAGSTYSWISSPLGFTSPSANPSVSPTETTTYTVTETITATGCTNTHSVTVTVNPLPAAVAGTDRAICTGTSTIIGATTVSGSTYSWVSSPLGFTSSSANPSVSPTETTTYTLEETITATGCTNTHTVTVTVNPLPAAAAGTDRAICTGTSTTIGATTVSGSTYSWISSPLGFTSSSANPSVSPTTTTTYTVTETITATGCTNTHSVTVTVNPLPAAVAGTDRAICTGASTNIGAATVSGSTYSWTSSPAGFTSSSANPSVSPTTTTTYALTETITATGCTNTHSVTVTVNPLPAAAAGTDRAICTGASTTIGATTVSGSTYSWTSLPSGFTSSSANPSVSPTETTTYTVIETITATGCTNTHTVIITVNPLPAAVAGTDRTICSATPTTIGAIAVAGSTYSWISSPAGFTSSSANPTVSPTTTTTYTVIETITATGCTNTHSVTVTVNPLPVVAAISGGAAAVCVNEITPAFTDATSGGVWSVTPGTGTASITTGGVVTGLTGGTVSVNYTVTDLNGCINFTSASLTVNTLPVVSPITGGAASVCINTTTPAFADVTPGGTWSITPGTGTATVSTGGVVTGLTGGTVTVNYFLTNSCGTTTVTAPLNIIAGPIVGPLLGTPAVCVGSTTQLTNATPGGITASNNPAIASVSITGLVTGVSAGSAIIYYIVPGNGCITTVEKVVTVNPLPVAATGPDVAICSGTSTTIGATTVSGSTYSWTSSPAGFTSSSANPTVSPTATTTYTLTETITATGCTKTNSVIVTVNPLPAAPTGTAAQSFCAANNPTVANLAIATGTNIKWYDAATGGNLLTGSTVLVTATHYYASQTVTGCESAARLDVTVTITTIAAPTGTASQSFCSGNAPTVADLSATGSSIKWYTAATNGTLLTSGTALTTATHYYASQTVSGCESVNRLDVTVTVNTTPSVPTGTASQSFCAANNPTVADLSATGTGIKWYDAATGGNLLTNTTALTTATHYYASQTITGCESAARLDVTVTITTTAVPTGTALQSFCAANAPTVADLSVTGTNIKWYSAATNGTLLNSTTVLTTSTHYYASQTISGCESVNRLDVTVTINPTPLAPTGTASQIFCSADNPTVAQLTTATGTNIKWYDAVTGGNLLNNSTALTTGTHYYASQTVSGCESAARLDVTVTINITPSAPTGTAAQSFCAANNPTVAQLTTATGTNIKWYDAATGGNLLNNSTALTTATHYYASQTMSSCESATRLDVTVTITTILAPTGTSAQGFCAANNPTVADLSATGTSIKWYDAATGGNLLTGSTALTTATHYYASQTVSGCESAARLDVSVTITTTAAPTGTSSQSFCSSNNPTVASLTASGTNIKWYDAATGGNLLTGSTALTTATHYYASQTVTGCESAARLDVSVTITTTSVPTGSASQSFCSSNNPTVANLSATGTSVKWYDAGTGGNLLTGSTALVTATHYYASQTISGCESAARLDVTVTITTTAAPTGSVSQSFCSFNNPTVASLSATGATIKWYDAATGGNLLTGSTALTTATHYYASQTVSSCESAARLDVTVTITTTAAPTGSAAQSFCSATNPTVAQLTTATGTNIKWYDAATGGNLLTGSTALTTATHYYASQTVSGCESAARLNVTVTVNTTPSAPNPGTITQPNCSTATGSVVLNGLPSAGTWTINPGAMTGSGTSTTVSGLAAATYNFTVTSAAGCISDLSVNVVINAAPSLPAAPIIGTITQPTCSVATGSVALSNLPSSGSWTISPGAITGSGTSTTVSGLAAGTYNFTVTNAAGCTSLPSTDAVVNTAPTVPTAPTGSSLQIFCSAANPTVADLTATGTNIKWYTAATNGTLLTNSTALATATHYYASQTTGSCESTTRLDVTVIINTTPGAPNVGTITQPTCSVPTGSVALSGLPSSGTWTINPGAISGTGTTRTVSGLAAGTYNFTVTSAAGCISGISTNVVINAAPAAPSTPTVTLIQPTCDLATGTITVVTPTGMTSYTVTGTSPVVAPVNQAGLVFAGLTEGTYNVTTTNASGCTSAPLSVTIRLDKAYWTGTVDDDWHKPGNWSTGQVPTASTHVFIPTGTSPCRVKTADAHAASVQAKSGATFEVVATWKIIIHGTCATLPAN